MSNIWAHELYESRRTLLLIPYVIDMNGSLSTLLFLPPHVTHISTWTLRESPHTTSTTLCHTYEWVFVHTAISATLCHTYEHMNSTRVAAHYFYHPMSHVWMGLCPHCYFRHPMSYIWAHEHYASRRTLLLPPYVTHMNESLSTLLFPPPYVIHMSKQTLHESPHTTSTTLCHTYEWVFVHTKESYRTYEWVIDTHEQPKPIKVIQIRVCVCVQMCVCVSLSTKETFKRDL